MMRLSENFYLIPTNKKRSSDSVLGKIKNNAEAAEKILQIRDIAVKFIEFEDQRDYKIEEMFNNLAIFVLYFFHVLSLTY